jgi:hypothetical protein
LTHSAKRVVIWLSLKFLGEKVCLVLGAVA